MNARTHRLTWRLAGLMALVLSAWLAPAKARAGCGDGHVSLRTRQVASESAPRPSRPRQPCSGPTCSRLPLAPPAVPPSVAPPAEDLAALAECTSLATPRPSRSLDDGLSCRPVRQGEAIFHPPR